MRKVRGSNFPKPFKASKSYILREYRIANLTVYYAVFDGGGRPSERCVYIAGIGRRVSDDELIG
jgi:hypothetical protein